MGTMPLPRHLKTTELRFGLLHGGEHGRKIDGSMRAGFGFEHEVAPLSKGAFS